MAMPRHAPSPSADTPPLQVGSVALAVRDLECVTGFYRDVIGLDLLGHADGTTSLGVDGREFLQLLDRPAAPPDNPAAAGLFHVAWLLPSRQALGRWLAHASRADIQRDGAADHLVSEAVYLHDPEGNGIEIYADRARATWRWTAHQVEMANRKLDIPDLIAGADGIWAGAPAGTRIGHVHLRVGDVERAVGFYGDVLGLEVTRMWPEAAFLSTGGYHHHIAANVWHSRGATARDPGRAGLAWVAMQAADTTIAAGIADRGHADDLGGAGLHDPWGTQVKIVVAKD